MFDGDGESRYDLITPAQVIKVLYYAQHNRKIRSYFRVALPIAGIDGTLQNRLKQHGVRHVVIAKTGSMTGVSSLSGYVGNSHGFFDYHQWFHWQN